MPLFAGCKRDEAPHFWNKPGTVLIRDHSYWVSLIMLYCGRRPAEIAQLTVKDIRQDQETCIRHIAEMSDEGGENLKSLKTLGSRRIVPLPPQLVRLGFLNYLEETKNAGHSRVFQFATRNARGQMIADFSRDFGRYLAKIGVKQGAASRSILSATAPWMLSDGLATSTTSSTSFSATAMAILSRAVKAFWLRACWRSGQSW